jgi:hypothetical protein
MHLSMYELVVLAIVWELTEFLEAQLGDDFGAHARIILLYSAPTAASEEDISAIDKARGMPIVYALL